MKLNAILASLRMTILRVITRLKNVPVLRERGWWDHHEARSDAKKEAHG
jgi:hypothetical protein